MLQYNLRPVGAVCLLLFCLVATGVHALDAGEVVALKDMQLEWDRSWAGPERLAASGRESRVTTRVML
jgi:hypothetical protein